MSNGRKLPITLWDEKVGTFLPQLPSLIPSLASRLSPLASRLTPHSPSNSSIPQPWNVECGNFMSLASRSIQTSNFTDFSGCLFHNKGKTCSNQDPPNFTLTPENRGSPIEKLKYPWAETLSYRFKTSAWEPIIRSSNDIFKTTTKPIENEICQYHHWNPWMINHMWGLRPNYSANILPVAFFGMWRSWAEPTNYGFAL